MFTLEYVHVQYEARKKTSPDIPHGTRVVSEHPTKLAALKAASRLNLDSYVIRDVAGHAIVIEFGTPDEEYYVPTPEEMELPHNLSVFCDLRDRADYFVASCTCGWEKNFSTLSDARFASKEHLRSVGQLL